MIRESVTKGFVERWLTSVAHIEEGLGLMAPVRTVLLKHGFRDKEAGAGGGVHELDTGYESFGAHYGSFEEMQEKLAADFRHERAQLDGIWIDTLNFAFISLEMEKKGETASVLYERGSVTMGFSDPRTEECLGPQCVEAIRKRVKK